MRPYFDTTTIVITTIVGIALLGGIITYVRATIVDTGPDTTSTGTTQAAPVIGSVQSPYRLIIPKINVDAHIQHVGLAKSGNMAVPTNYTDVGWYRLGTVPGQIGSAVIDGHVDNGFGKNAVFKRLSELSPGDDLFIQTETGSRLHFKVQGAEAYPVANVPLEKIFNRTDTARLTLITCSGAFDTGKLQYDQRTVVYAVLVP